MHEEKKEELYEKSISFFIGIFITKCRIIL